MARNSIIDITFPLHLIHCIILTDTLITEQKNWYCLIKTDHETTNTNKYKSFPQISPSAHD